MRDEDGNIEQDWGLSQHERDCQAEQYRDEVAAENAAVLGPALSGLLVALAGVGGPDEDEPFAPPIELLESMLNGLTDNHTLVDLEYLGQRHPELRELHQRELAWQAKRAADDAKRDEARKLERETGVPTWQRSLERYRDDGVMPGSFLQAVLRNDFIDAVVRADSDNRANLLSIALWVNTHLPATAWGDAARVEAWATSVRERAAA